jgi:hypothetical protein
MHEVVDVFRVDSDYENAVAFLDLNVVMNDYEVREILWKAV